MKNASLFVCILIIFNFNFCMKLWQQFWQHEASRAVFVSDSSDSDLEDVVQKILKLNPKTDQKVVTEFSKVVIKHGRQYQIDPDELIAIAFIESSFNPRARSKTDDFGIMQINWKTWGRFFDKKEDLYNIDKCVEMACKIIKKNRDSGYQDLACYHSRTPHLKLAYAAKLEICLAKLT